MKAIPTRYSNINFRSRLEAKWAAFFDKLRWPWEYEPMDFDGWIPDFLLGENRDILVEVKPFTTEQEFWESGTVAQIRASGFDRQKYHLLLLGVAPKFRDGRGRGISSIDMGWMYGKAMPFIRSWEEIRDSGVLSMEDRWYVATIGYIKASQKIDMYSPPAASLGGTIYPLSDDKKCVVDVEDTLTDDSRREIIAALWHEAVSNTQWQPVA